MAEKKDSHSIERRNYEKCE